MTQIGDMAAGRVQLWELNLASKTPCRSHQFLLSGAGCF